MLVASCLPLVAWPSVHYRTHERRRSYPYRLDNGVQTASSHARTPSWDAFHVVATTTKQMNDVDSQRGPGTRIRIKERALTQVTPEVARARAVYFGVLEHERTFLMKWSIVLDFPLSQSYWPGVLSLKSTEIVSVGACRCTLSLFVRA